MNDRLEAQLNDYVDGLLSAAEAARVERYLEDSEEARATVEFLQSLQARTDTLPESIEPRLVCRPPHQAQCLRMARSYSNDSSDRRFTLD